MVHQHDVGGVVEALALAEQAELGEHGLDLLVAVLAEVDLRAFSSTEKSPGPKSGCPSSLVIGSWRVSLTG
jgi:hypothetical protein